ncbi:MAG: hypothetical protein KC432_14255 [Thermomicrobiales bacterium]|nr:hypothetical protein [Thermomicrobiales bacterium]
MIVTQPALLCLASFWSTFTGRTSTRAVQADSAPGPASPPSAAVERATAIREERLVHATAVHAAPPDIRQDAVSADTPALEQPATAPLPDVEPAASGTGPLTANERRARAAALRALAFGRARRFDAAEAAFADAATLDPSLDLTRVPTFWSLERAAHEAAIAAYVAAGRAGDAAVLRARVQSVYRPKPLRPRGVPATT